MLLVGAKRNDMQPSALSMEGDARVRVRLGLGLPAGRQRLGNVAAPLSVQPTMAAGPFLGPLVGPTVACMCGVVLCVKNCNQRLQAPLALTPPRFTRVLQSRVQGDKACVLQEIN